LEGDRAWINLEGSNIDLPLVELEGTPDNTEIGSSFKRKFARGEIGLVVRYEVLSNSTVPDLGCSRTEYILDIEFVRGEVEENIKPESYGEGC